MPSVKLLFTFLITVLVSCSKSTTEPAPSDTMYFPSNTDTSWERKSLSGLGWNSTAAQSLKDYLVQKNTKSFMILVNGRIVMEEYFNGHSPVTTWQWDSAGKTLAATTTGIAQQEGLLQITEKASQYLGSGWTLVPIDKENLINIRHLLTMTSGINDASDLVIRPNLTYLADAGTRWSYHNVFQKLMDIVAAASGQDFETYFNNKLKNKIGMEGFWNFGVIFKIYHSNTRSMARFGLLALNKGKWNNEQVVNEPFFNESTGSSQSLNPSYGYLWWLNGKSGSILPGSQTYYPGTLIPNAPPDMYAAMGAEDQRIYVVPSKKMVVIRMGNAANPATPNFALSGFDNEFWGKLNAVIN